jgi:hypothetical protein
LNGKKSIIKTGVHHKGTWTCIKEQTELLSQRCKLLKTKAIPWRDFMIIDWYLAKLNWIYFRNLNCHSEEFLSNSRHKNPDSHISWISLHPQPYTEIRLLRSRIRLNKSNRWICDEFMWHQMYLFHIWKQTRLTQDCLNIIHRLHLVRTPNDGNLWLRNHIL